MLATAAVLNETRGNTLCERAEIADALWSRLRGLLGRAELPPGAGMLFQPESSIHSAFMRFEFDAVFLDRELRVVGLAERVPPWRMRAAKTARSVLELAAGEIELRGVRVGDQLAVNVVPEADQPGLEQAV